MPFAEGVVGTGGARIMAGYSMAGLFALYVPHVSRMFSGSVSASGSLWFPGFADFVRGTPFVRRPDAIYLSIGDRESRTRNPYLRTTEDRTRGLYDHYRAEGIDSVFELNPGNHFRDADLRLAKGISWAVPRCGGTPIIYWDEDDRT